METINKTILEKQSASTSKQYERIKKLFNNWKGNKDINETLVLEWLVKESEDKAPTTLSSQISLLLSYFKLELSLNIETVNIYAYIKALSSTYKKKQAAAFSKEDLLIYLNSLSNDDENLGKKLYILIAYYAALRTSKAVNLSFSDINESSDGLLVFIVRKKTDKIGTGENKLIPRDDNPLVCALTIFKLYSNVVPEKGRLWLRFSGGKYIKSPVGVNALAKYPLEIAKSLGKENPEKYTGHSFRVSSATIMADSGASTINLKRFGGWKSDTVAEGYIRNSKKAKTDAAVALSLTSNSNTTKSANTSSVVFNNCVFNNCKISCDNSSSSQEEK